MPDPSACSCGWPFPDMLKEKGKKAAHLRISFFQPLRNWGLPGNVGVYATVLPAAVVCCAVCVCVGGGWRRPRPAHGSGGCLHSRARTLVSPGTDSKYTRVWLENKAAQADRAVSPLVAIAQIQRVRLHSLGTSYSNTEPSQCPLP